MGKEITQEQMDAYDIELKKWHDYMDSIKPEKPTPDMFPDPGSFNQCMEIYHDCINEWNMKLWCDAPNRPGYYRANND